MMSELRIEIGVRDLISRLGAQTKTIDLHPIIVFHSYTCHHYHSQVNTASITKICIIIKIQTRSAYGSLFF